jgi:hypothetical protein
MAKKTNNPFPVRLGELKTPLQIEATQIDRSLHWLIKKILQTYVDSKKEKVEYNDRMQKMISD